VWRTVFPTKPDEADEEVLDVKSIQSRLQRLFPLRKDYEIVHTNLYKVHQRVADKFRVGRIFLMGDSAHVNNTIRGLGLNSGIHDAMELANTLDLVASEQVGDFLLDRYERRRKAMNIEYVQEATIANKKRLEEKDPKARRAHLDQLRAISDDPKRHK